MTTRCTDCLRWERPKTKFGYFMTTNFATLSPSVYNSHFINLGQGVGRQSRKMSRGFLSFRHPEQQCILGTVSQNFWLSRFWIACPLFCPILIFCFLWHCCEWGFCINRPLIIGHLSPDLFLRGNRSRNGVSWTLIASFVGRVFSCSPITRIFVSNYILLNFRSKSLSGQLEPINWRVICRSLNDILVSPVHPFFSRLQQRPTTYQIALCPALLLPPNPS